MKLLVTFFVLWGFTAFGQRLIITPLNDSVLIATTFHELETGPYPSNSMVIITKAGAVMIDTPWDTTQVLPLLDTIAARYGQTVVMCVATHFHADRTGGFYQLDQLHIPTWSSALTKSYCLERGEHPASRTFLHDTTFTVGGMTFETFFPGAGHAPDNIVVFNSRYDILYGGCFVKSTETGSPGNMEDADVTSWKKGIRKVQKRYRQPDTIITGHLSWSSRKSLKHTLKLLKAYEN